MSDLCRSDAAYVLGALSPVDRSAYEEHLRDCADCQASVRRLAGMPGLLALTSSDDIADAGPPVPESLLPGLIARVTTARRRRRWVVAGALAASLALLVALAGTLLVRPASETAEPSEPAAAAPATSAPTTAPVFVQPMTAVLAGPMTASLELVDKRWGTAITVICQYDGDVDTSIAYDLAVIDTDGHLDQAGTWRAVPGVTARVATATAVPRDRIASLEVRLPDGRTVLRSEP